MPSKPPTKACQHGSLFRVSQASWQPLIPVSSPRGLRQEVLVWGCWLKWCRGVEFGCDVGCSCCPVRFKLTKPGSEAMRLVYCEALGLRYRLGKYPGVSLTIVTEPWDDSGRGSFELTVRSTLHWEPRAPRVVANDHTSMTPHWLFRTTSSLPCGVGCQ